MKERLGIVFVCWALVVLCVPLASRAEVVVLPSGYSLGPLTELRDEIDFPELSADQKQVIASQARMLIEYVYVNRYHKEAVYGPSVAIGDRMAAIEQNAAAMPTKALELAIAQAWNSQRDGHLNFFFPKPYACYASMLPFSLVEVFAPDAEHAIVVKSLRSFASSLEEVPSIGDELVEYDGLPIERAIQEQIETHGGSNNSGGYAQAMYTLTVRDHRFHLVPEDDTVALTFRTPEGRLYTVDAPWTTQRDDWCVTPPNGYSMAEGTPDPLAVAESTSYPLRDDALESDSVNPYLLLCSDIESAYEIEPTAAGPSLIPTSNPDISYTLVENRYGVFGYLKLATFMSRGYQADAAFELIRDLLTTKLKDTRGLVLDLRGNPGGTIELAERLPQLFASRAVPVQGARLLNTELNAFILNSSFLGMGPDAHWSAVINEAAGTDARYTKTATFTTAANANAAGQAYFAPVAILTDALTYSAAEHFASIMQDERLATIWGEDLKTGGGASNAMDHANFVRYVGGPFVSLPAGQAMRVAWRQFIRTGRSAGMVLEDLAVTSDRRVRLTLDELLSGTPTQLTRITSDLYYLSTGGISSAYFDVPRQTETSIDALGLDLTVTNTDDVQVWLNGAFVSKTRVQAKAAKTVRIEIPAARVHVGDTLDIELRGFMYADQVWRVKKQLTVLGHMVTVPPEGLSFDFSTATDLGPFTVTNIKPWINSTPENGWRLRDAALGIGDGSQYKRNVKSDLSVMLDLSGRTDVNLEVTADVQTERKYDYVDVYVTSGDETFALDRWTGLMPTTTYSYDLSFAAGKKNVGLHLLFYSDGYMTDRGVEISSLRLF